MSVIGTWTQRVGQDVLVLQLTHSGVALGACLACQFVPQLVGGMWSGSFVDRQDKRRLVMATQFFQALLAGALSVVTLLDLVNLEQILVMAFLLGVVTTFDVPARQALVAQLVPRADLVNAFSLASTVMNLGRLVGPAAAGWLIALAGVGAAFAVNAVSFLAVLIGLACIRSRPAHEPTPVDAPDPGVRAGLRYVWASPDLRADVVLMTLLATLGQNFRVVLPLLALVTLHGDARTLGYLMSAMGLGAVGGALLSASVRGVNLTGLLLAAVGFGLASLASAATTSLPFVLAGLVLLGATNVVVNTVARTLLLTQSAPTMHGRVMGIFGVVSQGTTPIGAPVLGIVCALTSPRAGLVLGGLSGAVPAVAILARQRSSRRPRLSPTA